MKILKRYLLAMAAASMAVASAQAVGWPANYEGVMFQGFGWDTYSDTKWTNLESQADELSKSFDLIWIPNSASCGGGNNMGYMPQYWFTNHNSSFGTEAELLSMIETFKAKGTGFIADVVINHRNGVTNWTDFPAEEWNGRTWQLGPEHICSTDEVRNASGQARPTGAPDTGDDFDGARDLDHTNATVQDNCKNYCKCLLEKYGYVGFRYDMVKGYGGQYTKIYNQYSKPTYSVGEYWDSNYDAVKGWIEATGKESAAFDFPFKYAVNEAFSTGDMTKLAWAANGDVNNMQPAGMIHFAYSQYAVTFVDNHDTYRDGSAFNGNVVAANAFMLCSPGTPCVFLPHWKANKAAIKQLIAVRKAVGVSNTSSVKVLKLTNNCYMAEVTGSKGKLVVKVGSAMDSPAGYTNDDIKASGNDYCVWSKVGVIGGGDDDDDDDDPILSTSIKIYFDNTQTAWGSVNCYSYANSAANNGQWPGNPMTAEGNNVYSATVPAGSSVVFNFAGGSQSVDVLNVQDKHIYRGLSSQTPNSGGTMCNEVADGGVYAGGNGDDDNYPNDLYIVGTINNMVWDTLQAVPFSEYGQGVFTWHRVTFDSASALDENAYFTFITRLDSGEADWSNVNMGDRYGATVADATLTVGETSPVKHYVPMVDASAAKSWAAPAGLYDVALDLKNMTVKITKSISTGVDAIYGVEDVPAEYYDLTGARVQNPAKGIYIVRRGNSVSKEYVR